MITDKRRAKLNWNEKIESTTTTKTYDLVKITLPPPPKTLEQVKNTIPIENRKYEQVHCRLVYTYVLM